MYKQCFCPTVCIIQREFYQLSIHANQSTSFYTKTRGDEKDNQCNRDSIFVLFNKANNMQLQSKNNDTVHKKLSKGTT